MKKKLVIVGTGLFAEVACSYFEELSNYSIVAFACHESYKRGDKVFGRPLVAIESMLHIYPKTEVDVFVAIGYGKMNKMREHVYQELKDFGYSFANFVHPSVKIWPSTTVGENVFIFENNTIQPFTKIGDNTIIWSGNHFGHHGSIGNHCFIASHVVISGYCVIGDNVFIGVNATLKDGVNVANETLIGAATTILRDTKPKEVYAAQATKPFEKSSDEINF